LSCDYVLIHKGHKLAVLEAKRAGVSHRNGVGQKGLCRASGRALCLIADEDELRRVWSDPDNREHFLSQLSDRGYDRDRLDDIRRLVDAPDSDLFDVLGYVLFTLAPRTRQERAGSVRSGGMQGFDGELRELLLGILKAYEVRGEGELATKKLTQFLTARYGSVNESKTRLGGLPKVKEAFKRMQSELYAT
jgi:type I restriction enzyme R subunit